MQYLMLIYEPEEKIPAQGTPEFNEILNGYLAFTAEVQEKGSYLGGNALDSVKTATTVRVRDGKTEATDGPFAETKEQLGGYYLLDCKDLDEALEAAAKIPCAKTGCIEVRPVKLFEEG